MPAFTPAGACWVCGGSDLAAVHDCVFDLAVYQEQDPALSAYTGAAVTMMRCRACGFTQPANLPALDRFFERMYDQRWNEDWVAREFESDAKSAIFDGILDVLESRLPHGRRRLLDVGAHVGRFLAAAAQRGWQAEGIELNPTTAGYARRRTGLSIHDRTLRSLAGEGRRFDAVTLTDVLEHIPHPVPVLRDAARVLDPGGWVAVKVPCGPNQLLKERIRRTLRLAPRVSVADNLVHVSHFSRAALRLALEGAGFQGVTISVGRPERNESPDPIRRAAANLARTAAYTAARLVPGARSPLAFNLQAFACTSGPVS